MLWTFENLSCEELMWDVCFWYLVWIVFAKEDLKQWTMPLGYTFWSMQLWWMVNSQLWISWWSHYIKKNEWINWVLASVHCKEHNGIFGSFVEKCLPCLLCVLSRIGHLDQFFLEEDGYWWKWINIVVDFMIYIWIKYYLYSFCDIW